MKVELKTLKMHPVLLGSGNLCLHLHLLLLLQTTGLYKPLPYFSATWASAIPAS